jgi:uncharacterized membrane protein
MIHNRLKRWPDLLAMVITILAAVLRLYHLDANSLWIDEIGQVWHARQGFSQALYAAKVHVAAMPLDYIITYLVSMLGKSDFVVRLPAAVFGICSVLLTYWMGKRLFDPAVGLCAAFLLAISPMHIFYSQEARFYSLFTCLSIIMVLLFEYARQWQSLGGWIIFAFAALAASYSHYYAFMVMGVLTLYSLTVWVLKKKDPLQSPLNRRTVFMILLCFLGVLAATSPWLIYSGMESTSNSKFIFTWPDIAKVVSYPVIGPWPPSQFLGMWIFPALALIGSFGKKNLSWLLMGLLVILPTTAVLLLDNFFSYFFAPRQLLFIVPFYLLLVASGLVNLANFSVALMRRLNIKEERPVLANAILILLTAIVATVLYPQIKTHYETPKDINWRDMAAVLVANSTPGQTALIIVPEYLGRNLYYYQQLLMETTVDDKSVLFNDLQSQNTTTRYWLLSSPQYLSELRSKTDWNAFDIGLSSGAGYRLYYLGQAETTLLQKELAGMSLLPEVYANTNLLYTIQTQDPTLALELAQASLDAIDDKYPPMLGVNQARLITTVARIYLNAGRVESSQELVDRVQSMNVIDMVTMNNLGRIYIQTEQCNLAVDILQRDVEYYSENNFFGFYALGDAYMCEQKWEQAIIAYQYAFEATPDPRALLKIAEAQIAFNNPEMAMQTLEIILADFEGTSAGATAQKMLEDLNK